MAIFVIQDRRTGRERAVIEAPSQAQALEWAVRRGLSLRGVDLTGLDLRGAFLAGADLRGAGLKDVDLAGGYLRRADLRAADLRGTRLAHSFLGSADLRLADLRDTDLSRADLRDALLTGADLRGTVLTCARLEGTFCDWRWAAIPAELLRQEPDPKGIGSGLVVALAFHDDTRPWSWLKRIVGQGPTTEWALTALAAWVRDGDNAPELLRSLTADAIPDRATTSGPSLRRQPLG